MFWGLIMEPQRRYTQKVKKAFHISMASLDVSTSSEEPAQVMVGFEGRNYLLCTLRKPDLLQCALDLNFEVGDELSLAANGKCHVHLTGYLIEDPDEFAEEEEEDDEDEEVILEKDVQKKSKKRNKEAVTNGPPVKKIKSNNKDAQAEESEEDDSDDSDVDVKSLLQKTLEESDEDDDTFVSDAEDNAEEEEEEDGEEDDSELEEVEEEEDDDDESSLSEADSDVDAFTTGKLNGTPKKQEVITPNKQKEKKDKKNEQKKQNTKEVKTQVQTPNKENKSPKSKETKKVVLQNGLIIEDVKEGQGPPAKPGKFISVYYEGRLKSNNKVFDATNKGAGFSFRLGGGEVIKGWDAGLVGMKLGGKRRLTCPPNMAYGPKGSPPAIPANSTLVFEVELKKIR